MRIGDMSMTSYRYGQLVIAVLITIQFVGGFNLHAWRQIDTSTCLLGSQMRANCQLFMANKESGTSLPFSVKQIEDYGRLMGISMHSKTNGLSLQLDAFRLGDDVNDENQRIGYLTAFVRPGVFHLDTIRVKNRRQLLNFHRDGWTADGPGMSFLLGSWAVRWAHDKGYKTAQLLAVNDSDDMHRILVKLYSSFGFREVKYIDDSLACVPDRLVWGAVGTLMELDIVRFLDDWAPKFESFMLLRRRK